MAAISSYEQSQAKLCSVEDNFGGLDSGPSCVCHLRMCTWSRGPASGCGSGTPGFLAGHVAGRRRPRRLVHAASLWHRSTPERILVSGGVW